MEMSSLNMSLSKASKDTMPSFLHTTRQRWYQKSQPQKREESHRITLKLQIFFLSNLESHDGSSSNSSGMMVSFKSDLKGEKSYHLPPRFLRQIWWHLPILRLQLTWKLPQISHHHSDLSIFDNWKCVFFKLNQWDISTVGPHLVRLTISLGVFEH